MGLAESQLEQNARGNCDPSPGSIGTGTPARTWNVCSSPVDAWTVARTVLDRKATHPTAPTVAARGG
jgi:hypothetical protein